MTLRPSVFPQKLAQGHCISKVQKYPIAYLDIFGLSYSYGNDPCHIVTVSDGLELGAPGAN
jgi:hypothetical protein